MKDAQLAGALFDFAGYLTTLDRSVTLGAAHDASVMVELLRSWASERGLELDEADVRGWQDTWTRADMIDQFFGMWCNSLPDTYGAVGCTLPEETAPHSHEDHLKVHLGIMNECCKRALQKAGPHAYSDHPLLRPTPEEESAP